jgi:predicted Ser/Thr protein kinase
MPDEPPPPGDLSGQSLGDFLLLRKIGQGGMGQVYLARQQSLKRDVALKILKGELASNPTSLQRFRAEAEAVAKITHANIVQVYAVGEQDGTHYMALEYVEGRNLRDYLARKGPPDLPVALAIIRQVASALQRANELGLVHRDIKPENILVTRKAEVKVADFGLSKFFVGDAASVHLTQSGMTLGTPLYMSPEQIKGDATDHRSDLYSFGVTCYHLLAGEPPFLGKTPFEVTIQHVQKEPPPLAAIRPDLPPDLCAMVHKLMAKRPEDRYASAKDVLRDLTKVREGMSLGLPMATQAAMASPYLAGMTSSVPLAAPPRPVPWGRAVAFAAGGVLFAGVGFAVAATWPRAAPASAAVEPGLPTARPAERPVATRELDLKAKIDSTKTKEDEALAAAIQLGLLYVQERRWGEADALFREMESGRLFRGNRPQEMNFVVAGKLGKGVSLAHQDKAEDSNQAFLEVVSTANRPPRPPGEFKGRPPLPGAPFVQQFFFRHPDLSRAVAEAVTRNGENSKKDAKLEWLCRPGTLVGGPKGS